MKSLLPKTYTPADYEEDVYYKWESSGFFNPDNLPGPRKKAFSISLPPPNVTGKLHIGHAVMLAYQDIMIRYHRLKGEKTLWLPGMDHAAIATQSVVEKELNKEGQTRYDLGREKFLERVNKFAEESKAVIRSQIKATGASLDWSREKFTLDKDLSRAVRIAFKTMYDDGLIYRGSRVVNWCPKCQSTLSDDEVEYQETEGKLYYIKYGPITIATTRPETKLGDTGVAVNPKDKRYKDLIGKEIDVNLASPLRSSSSEASHKIKVKVFADRAVDQEFGTGAIGVTPAHSQQDAEWAEKYNLDSIKIINEKGIMTDKAGKYQGLSVLDCREKFVSDLEKAGLIEKVEDYTNNLSICYRCDTPIEPLPSKQWFVAVNKKIPGRNKSLKELAGEVVKKGDIKIIPDRFNKTYFQWMDNLRDWCISRQIWYGHRIPVWYCLMCTDEKNDLTVNIKNNNLGITAEEAIIKRGTSVEPIVSIERPDKCPKCGCKDKNKILQDPDTLDTWFSSALWTFSTLGWPASAKATAGKPQKIGDLKTFHPTSVMETGYDLIFFWVARMIIMSLYLLKEIPFKTVYFHGLVRTKTGAKMSKSKPETCIDPLAMIKKFGTDALRLSMMVGATPGNDVRLFEEKIAGYRNFVNKLWNISRYILSSVESIKRPKIEDLPRLRPLGIVSMPTRHGGELVAERSGQVRSMTLADKWILQEFHQIVESTTKNIEEYKFSPAGEELYEFTWSKLADWYLEIAKIEGDTSTGSTHSKDDILLYILERLLILWHPFCPYVTEVLWDEFKPGELLMIQKWPCVNDQKSAIDNQVKKDFSLIQKIITSIRNTRAENKIDPKKVYSCLIRTKKNMLIEENKAVIEGLAKVRITPKCSGIEIHLNEAEIVLDIKENNELKKNKEKEIVNLKRYIEIQEQKLANQNFTSKAPQEVIRQEKEKLEQARDKLDKLLS
ncbi:valine--tRNA ligase [Patescibacteria group bacterium]|nr:valine--tRNA ligase [Patescibacteria group bacterium]